MQKREEKFRQMKKEDKNGGIKDRRKEKKVTKKLVVTKDSGRI